MQATIRERYGRWKGEVRITNKTTGQIVDVKNGVTAGFYEGIADLWAGTPPSQMSYIGFGDNNTAFDESQTALLNEIARIPITGTATPGDTIELSIDVLGNQAAFNWKELGIFTESVGGIMTNRVVVDFTHNAGDLINIAWTITRE